jgi:hypothetical protein
MTTYRVFDLNRASRDFSTQFFDFHDYTAAQWLITAVGAATAVLSNAIGGKLLITNAAADDNSEFFQWKGSDAAVRTQWAFTTGKKLQFTHRVSINEVLQSDYIAGLHSVQTAPIATPPTNGFYFRKDDATARLWFCANKAGVETKLDTQTDMVAGTEYDLEFYYDGSHTTIAAFINQVKVGSLPVAAGPASGTLLALSFGLQNGEAVAKNATIDFIGAQVQR